MAWCILLDISDVAHYCHVRVLSKSTREQLQALPDAWHISWRTPLPDISDGAHCLPVVLQVEVFCIANLINCALEADEENIVKDYHFAGGGGGLGVCGAGEGDVCVLQVLGRPVLCR
jgi:hypothetical protein